MVKSLSFLLKNEGQCLQKRESWQVYVLFGINCCQYPSHFRFAPKLFPVIPTHISVEEVNLDETQDSKLVLISKAVKIILQLLFSIVVKVMLPQV